MYPTQKAFSFIPVTMGQVTARCRGCAHSASSESGDIFSSRRSASLIAAQASHILGLTGHPGSACRQEKGWSAGEEDEESRVSCPASQDSWTQQALPPTLPCCVPALNRPCLDCCWLLAGKIRWDPSEMPGSSICN